MKLGSSYNGYTWQQRARILSAYRKLGGRSAPFERLPCAMCCDPDRPPGEWHSEDYSEPYTFQPPQTYPLCKPCHGRLHKRFNAVPGEWELFCLHLEAGGYGSEFVRLYSLFQRRALSGEIAAGAKIKLPNERRREPGPYWWRDLTLDPESLHAPWARPRPLLPRPDEAAFVEALAKADLSNKEVALLRTHAHAPRRTATMRTLAKEALGVHNPQSANLIYGRLAARLTKMLEWTPDCRTDGSPVWMSLVAEGWSPPDREFEWTMVPTLAAAARYFILPQALSTESCPDK